MDQITQFSHSKSIDPSFCLNQMSEYESIPLQLGQNTVNIQYYLTTISLKKTLVRSTAHALHGRFYKGWFKESISDVFVCFCLIDSYKETEIWCCCCPTFFQMTRDDMSNHHPHEKKLPPIETQEADIWGQREFMTRSKLSAACLSPVGEPRQRAVKQWLGLVRWVSDGGECYGTAARGCSPWEEECLTPCSRQTLGSLFMFLLRYLGMADCLHSSHTLMTYGLAWYLEVNKEREHCWAARTTL